MKGQHFNFNQDGIEDENDEKIMFSNNNSFKDDIENMKNEIADEDSLVR